MHQLHSLFTVLLTACAHSFADGEQRHLSCAQCITGPLKPKELIAFLQQHAGEAAAEQPEAAGKKPADEAEAKKKAETEVAQVVKHVKVGEVKGLAEKEDALLLAFFGGEIRFFGPAAYMPEIVG